MLVKLDRPNSLYFLKNTDKLNIDSPTSGMIFLS